MLLTIHICLVHTGWLGALLTGVGLAHTSGSQLVWAAGLGVLCSTPAHPAPGAADVSSGQLAEHTGQAEAQQLPRHPLRAARRFPCLIPPANGSNMPTQKPRGKQIPSLFTKDSLSHVAKGMQAQPGVKSWCLQELGSCSSPHGINGIQHANTDLDLQSRLFTCEVLSDPFMTQWTAARLTPLSLRFLRKEHCSG